LLKIPVLVQVWALLFFAPLVRRIGVIRTFDARTWSLAARRSVEFESKLGPASGSYQAETEGWFGLQACNSPRHARIPNSAHHKRLAVRDRRKPAVPIRQEITVVIAGGHKKLTCAVVME